MGDVSVRALGPADAAAIQAVDKDCLIQADFAFEFDRGPDFFLWPRTVFDACSYAGVFVGEELAGYCMVGFRKAWTGVEWGSVFYFGDARVRPRFRGRRLSELAMTWLAENSLQAAQLGFCVIKRGNEPATRLARTARATGFAVRRLCGFDVVNIPLLRRPRVGSSCAVRPALPADLPAVADVAQTAQRGRLLAPCNDEAWLRRTWLELEGGRTFAFVAERSGRICGSALFRDPGPARQTRVVRYPPGARLLQQCFRAAARVTGASPLPPPGKPFRSLLAVVIAVEGNDPAVARDLLAAGMAAGVEHGYQLLHVGLADGDPITPVLRHRLAPRFRSDLYLIARPAAFPAGWERSKPVVDLAML